MYYDWIIGIGLMFGFGLVLSYLDTFTIESFLGYETLMSAFTVWMNLLPLWILIINILVLVYITMSEIKNRSL